jgi:hypothetical protein
VLTATLLCLTLAACGSSNKSTTTTAAASTVPKGVPNGAQLSAAAKTFRECMANHGIKAQPGARGGLFGGLIGAGAKLPKGVTLAQARAALRACGAGARPLGRLRAPNTKGFGNLQSPKAKKAFEAFSACLREKGVNLGAPNLSGHGPIFSTKGVNVKSPQFRAAARACAATLSNGVK